MHIEVDGMTKLSEALEDLEYPYFGDTLQNAIQFLNYDTEPVYLHFRPNGTPPPEDTETHGMPICNDTAVAPASFYNVEKGCRLANTYLYSAAPVTIKVEII